MNSPKEIANNYIAIGKGKVNTPVAKMFVLGILAGIFIAFGGVASTAVAVSIPLASVGKFLGACIFPGGLTMVLLAGSELFTGNCLLVIPLCKKEITLGGMLKNWVVVKKTGLMAEYTDCSNTNSTDHIAKVYNYPVLL